MNSEGEFPGLLGGWSSSEMSCLFIAGPVAVQVVGAEGAQVAS